MNRLLGKSVVSCLVAFVSVAFSANPLNFGSDVRTADPSGHVWADGKMYLYCSHDEECQVDFFMKDWRVFSSSDLVSWTDHGAPLSIPKDLTWADNYAWAPDAAYINGKYYFVFPAGNGVKDRINPANSTKWMGVGVAESDSPTGPFKDNIGNSLWKVPYANDPCIFVDDDKKVYLYYHGGGDWRVYEMSDDMRSVKGASDTMLIDNAKPKQEGQWVFKRNNIYYYTFPKDNRVLSYYTSDSPKGPWTYKGEFMEQENESNNHHSIVQYKGQWVIFYHRWLIRNNDPACPTKKQRHVCAEYIYFNDDGTIKPVKRTDEGVDFSGASANKSDGKASRLSTFVTSSNGEIFVNLPKDLNPVNISASLYSLSGQTMSSVNRSNESQSILLQMNEIPHGIYILKLESTASSKELFTEQHTVVFK